MKIVTLLLSFTLMAAQAYAFRISDSSTSDHAARSTYSSLNESNTISTYGYQNSYGISVGMVVAFTSKNEIATPDRIKWLECNGQSFNKDEYPELYIALGANVVPNLNGQFMRGTSDKNLVLTRREDSIKSYNITIPEHTHKFGLTATGTVQILKINDIAYTPKLNSSSDSINSVKEATSNRTVTATSIPRTVNGTSTLQNSKITGTINSSGKMTGHYSGALETAPRHTYVRYFIRAIP